MSFISDVSRTDPKEELVEVSDAEVESEEYKGLNQSKTAWKLAYNTAFDINSKVQLFAGYSVTLRDELVGQQAQVGVGYKF